MAGLESTQRLLILYGSQTGNAQDVAERISREARLMLFSPVVLPMDAYPMQHLPQERYVVFVAATTGQGDPPDNMRRFWKLLLRKSLPATALIGMQYAVFGLGDSGYVKFNVAAKKLDRRLAGLGAKPLLERGLGDDQHPSGYESALDPWLQQLWVSLREQCPLPQGVTQPVLDEAAMLQLGPAKYLVTYLAHPAKPLFQQQQQQPAGPSERNCALAGAEPCQSPQQEEQELIEQAVAAAAAFRRVAAEAAGMAVTPAAATSGVSSSAAAPACGGTYGPWQPFMAPVLINQRVTSSDHFQDTRHIEFDIRGSGLEQYQPGDLLAVFPRTPAADVEAALVRLGLNGDALIRIEAAHQACSVGGSQQQQPQQTISRAVCEAPVRAVLQGVLDLSGASPRRYLFQVLSHFTSDGMQQERLRYFASAEGRDDLYRYNQRERRSLLEVLQDFSAAAPPLERLLECAPLLSPRLFSLASAPAAHPGRAAILMAVVRWVTPTKRLRKGLLSNWLANLQPAEAAGDEGSCSSSGRGKVMAGGAGPTHPFCAVQMPAANGAVQPEGQQRGQQRHHVCVPVWVERGALRLPPSHGTPLLLVGPGTGVAPFRSFLWQRAAAQQLEVQQQQQQQQGCGLQQSSVASSTLFFGCRSPFADFYYESEWYHLLQRQVLQQQTGFIAAFSRYHPQPDQQHLLQLLQQASHADSTLATADRGGDGGRTDHSVQAVGADKVYVTHKLREHGELVWQLLSEGGAWVYVSGSAEKMPAGVAAALQDVAVQHGRLTAEAAEKFVRHLELTGRYHVEAWS